MLAVEDIRRAADLFHSVYEQSEKKDGYVSLETPPGIENDVEKTVVEARRLFSLVDRPNVLIKVPGTDAGIQALEVLIGEGINVNVTLIFDVSTYQKVAEAYIRGLEKRNGAPLRLIVPGWYGIANVKWLQRIEVRDSRYMGRFMGRDYVTVKGQRRGDEVVFTETSVTRIQLKS